MDRRRPPPRARPGRHRRRPRLRAYETLLTLGYMLRTLMIDTLGAEAAETAIQDASAAAEDDAAGDLKRATALL